MFSIYESHTIWSLYNMNQTFSVQKLQHKWHKPLKGFSYLALSSWESVICKTLET